MPDRQTIERAQEDKREGKSPSTQAGEFVREEIHHIREGKHGARSPQQAIAIGLSKARRAGVELPPPKGPSSTRRKAQQDLSKAEGPHRKSSSKRSKARETVLNREPKESAGRQALSRHAKSSASKRGSRARRKAALKAARTRKAA